MKNKRKRILGVVIVLCTLVIFLNGTFAYGMSISESGIAFIKKEEGFRAYQYQDNTQISIGYGTGIKNGEYPNGITEQQADVLLRNRVKVFEQSLNDFLSKNNISLSQNQYDALVSFTYNVGTAWMSACVLRSCLLKGVNNCSEEEIRDAFGRWKYEGNKVSQGLVKRREQEATMFLSGSTLDNRRTVDSRFPANITTYPLSSSGKITLYNSSNTPYATSTRYIDYSDLCVINEVYTDGYCKVTYPSSSSSTGKNTEYAKISDFVDCNINVYNWSAKNNTNVYKRENCSEAFGTIWPTDKCIIVSEKNNKKQVIYSLDSGGYKMGWISSSDNLNSDPLPSVKYIPGPVASGIFDEKQIVVMANQKISFSTKEYIEENDICVLKNVNSQTGNCIVTYPSGSSDVFASGTASKDKEIATTFFIDYQPEFQMQKLTTEESIKVYPNASKEEKGTSWTLDKDDEYYTVGRASNGMTEVLYYCSRGKHSGYWKLGWVDIGYYWLDLNGFIDGSGKDDIDGAGIADIYVNGNKLVENGTDFSSENGLFPYGSSFEIRNIRAADGMKYVGIHSGNISGKLLQNTKVSLTFEVDKEQCKRIEIESKPSKLKYKEGEKLELNGLKVVGYLSNNETIDVTKECTISGFDSSSGIKNICVKYKDFTVAFSVMVEGKKPTALVIKKKPSKTQYFMGEELDISGLKVVAEYDNNTTAEISDYEISMDKNAMESEGIKEVTVYYKHNETDVYSNFEIQVNSSSFEQGVIVGDVDSDGTVTSKDLIRMRKHLTGQEVEINEKNADINHDGKIDSLDLIRLRKIFVMQEEKVDLPHGTELVSSSRNSDGITTTAFTYGKSTLGRDLVCWSIAPDNYYRTVLLNFEIHGWEDEYEKDGQLLVDLGNALVKHYKDSSDMYQCRLLIIPSCNPDGLQEGTTNNGFGRCNAEGIDLNRDFDADHQVYASGRNYTQYPFSANETRAMKDLVLNTKPDVVIDFHGWENCTIGSADVAEVFSTNVGLNHKNELSTSAHGYFSYWAQKQGAKALLVEFKNSSSIVNRNVINAVDQLIQNEYGALQNSTSIDENYNLFCPISTYTLSSDKVYTQRNCGDVGTDYGYIDGATDLCTIVQIYDDGWCKVRYPVSNNYMKTGYCQLSNFIDFNDTVIPYGAKVSINTSVYRTMDRTSTIGTVWSTDEIMIIAKNGENVQIIYPLDNGGYKMGWILEDEIGR